MGGVYSKTFPRNTSSFYVCSHPSGGRFWYRVPSKEQGKGSPERTKRAVGVSRTEDASGAAVGCFWHGTPLEMRPVGRRLSTVCGSAVLRAFENASRTTEGCFWHRISLPYRRSLFFTPNASENASRTPGSLFAHGTHIPYHRWPSPVPNARHRGRLPPRRSLTYKKAADSVGRFAD